MYGKVCVPAIGITSLMKNTTASCSFGRGFGRGGTWWRCSRDKRGSESELDRERASRKVMSSTRKRRRRDRHGSP